MSNRWGGGRIVDIPNDTVPDILAPLDDTSDAPGVAADPPYVSVGAVRSTSPVTEK